MPASGWEREAVGVLCGVAVGFAAWPRQHHLNVASLRNTHALMAAA